MEGISSTAAIKPDRKTYSKPVNFQGARNKGILVSMALLLTVSVCASLCVGALPVSFGQLFGIIADWMGINTAFTYDEQQKVIIEAIRLPRVLLGMLVGAGLGISGAALQGLFRNPLADPGLIGITAGASFFAVLIIVFHASVVAFLGTSTSIYLISIASFAGAMLTTWMVYKLSKVNGKAQIATMLLAGIAINAFAGAFTGLMTYIATDEQLRSITFWSLGSLGGATWTTIQTLTPFILITLIFLPRMGKALNTLALGENQAAHLGVNMKNMKRRVIILSTLSVGASVAVAGSIGFVGLIVPHILRKAFGPDHKLLLPGSAIGGAVVLTLSDTLARTIVAPAELPIGVLTALLGTPVFVYILIKEKRISHD